MFINPFITLFMCRFHFIFQLILFLKIRGDDGKYNLERCFLGQKSFKSNDYLIVLVTGMTN